MIPYINKTVDVIISEHIEARTVNVREIIDEFRGQVDEYTSFFEAVVFMGPGRFRVTFKSACKMGIAMHAGLIVRGYPVEFKSVSPYKWVNVTRLSYGIPEVAIHETLGPYGNIRLVKSEIYSNIYTGVRQVLMEVRKDIPTRIHIAGHWCFTHYRGQKRTCFQCGEEGHQKDKCPRLQSSVPVRPTAAAEETATANGNNNSAATVAPPMDTLEPAASTVVAPSLRVDNATIVPATEEVAPIIQGILDAVCPAVLPESTEAPPAAEVVTAVIEDEEPDRSGNRPKRKGNGKRHCSRSRSPVDRSREDSDEVSAPQGQTGLADTAIVPASQNPVSEHLPSESAQLVHDPVQVSTEVQLTSRDPLIDLPFNVSDDDDTDSVSDASLGLSLGDVSALEEVIDRYKDCLNTDTPLTQYSPNLPCPTQERVVFDDGPESTPLSEESRIVTRFSGNVSSHEEDEED